jgi:colanic acid biosynthesis glycosyl transferase WcaI
MAQRGWDVIVYSASRGYDDPAACYPAYESRAGVTVRRLPLSSFGKSSIAVRLLAQGLFIFQAIVRAAFIRGVDRVLVSTVPPFSNIGGVILSWIHRAPLIWWVMDLNPDQLVRLGKARPTSLSVRVFDWLNRVTLRSTRAVVVLDDYMRERLIAKTPPAGSLHVLPPWPHEAPGVGVSREENPFRTRHDLQGMCVVMYSGNHGLTNPLGTLIKAAERLRDHPTLRFLFVGGGVNKPEIAAFIKERRLENAMSLPYQPLTELKYSLPAADVHVVSISPEAVGVSHSCKIYGAMAVGRPILALAPAESHVGRIMAAHDCGWVREHGDVDGLVSLLERLAAMPPRERDAVGERGARAVRDHYKPDVLVDTMCQIVYNA